MRNVRQVVRLALVATLVATAIGSANEWKPIGLESDTIRCVISIGSDHLMAATRGGVYVYDGRWHRAYTGLPVTDLEAIRPDVVLATVGNGSRSDAVLLGQSILDGPPYFVFDRLTWLVRPGPLAVKESTGAGPRVYVASGGTRVFTGLLELGTNPSLELRQMGLPDGAFGVEDPYCTALHVFSEEGGCYAGGYDRSPLPGPASLLREVSLDSMNAVRTMNISALTELRAPYTDSVSAGTPRDTVVTMLTAGTSDQGVLLRTPSLGQPSPRPRWRTIPTPRGQRVTALLAAPAAWDSTYQALVLGVEDGVYAQCPPLADCTWTETGDIPSAPLDLCLDSTGTLVAGTYKGAYAFVPTSSANPQPQSLSRPQGRTTLSRLLKQGRSVRLCRIDGRSTMVSSPHELNTLPKGVYVNADATPGEQGRLTVKP